MSIPPTDVVRLAVGRIESDYDAQVVSATMIGAHQHGLTHDTSDIDLFVTVSQPAETALGTSDSITREFETYDIGNGVDAHIWSRNACVGAVANNNPIAVEALTVPSPTYIRTEVCDRWKTLNRYVQETVNRYGLSRHYLGKANQQYNDIENGEPTIKQVLQTVESVYRSILAESGELPPHNTWDLRARAAFVPDMSGELPRDLLLALMEEIEASNGDNPATPILDTYCDGDFASTIEPLLDREFSDFDETVHKSGPDGETLRAYFDHIWREVRTHY